MNFFCARLVSNFNYYINTKILFFGLWNLLKIWVFYLIQNLNSTGKNLYIALWCVLSVNMIQQYSFHINQVININWKRYGKNAYVSFHLNVPYSGNYTFCILHCYLFLILKFKTASCTFGLIFLV